MGLVMVVIPKQTIVKKMTFRVHVDHVDEERGRHVKKNKS